MVNPCPNASADPALENRSAATVLDEPAARVLRRFRQVFNAVKTHFQQVERQVGVGGAQVWALSVIQARPGIGVNELAKALDIRQSTASNLVRALVDRGLVATSRAERDRRAVELRLLPPGAQVLAQSPGLSAGCCRRRWLSWTAPPWRAWRPIWPGSSNCSMRTRSPPAFLASM
jgi:DNA-binding MarR family transcriptional regulator